MGIGGRAVSTIVFLSWIVGIMASAAPPNLPPERAAALDGLLKATPQGTSGERLRLHFSDDGYLRSYGAPAESGWRSGLRAPTDAAQAFLKQYRPLLVESQTPAAFEARTVKSAGRRRYAHFGQTYSGIPVYGAGIVVQLDDTGKVAAVLSDLMRSPGPLAQDPAGLKAGVEASRAQAVAVETLSGEYAGLTFEASTPALVVYDPEVLGLEGKAILAWKLECSAVDDPVRELFLIDARSGSVALRYSLIAEAKHREIYDAANMTGVGWGTLARREGDPPSAIADVNIAYDYFGDTYDFYFNFHNRDSINNLGSTLSATVRYCQAGQPCPYPNAFWDGARMYFGQGFAAADDVVSHELTHGVTENESGLIYSGESGSMNESFSDMWGEWVDLTNTGGTDTPEVRWLMGEDIPGLGAIRDMADPPAFGDPDRKGSPLWYTGAADNGGVHTNSGVGNKLCFLLTDGGTFNGRTVTGMGIPDASALIYECQTNLLLPGSDYEDLYLACAQAAINLGWTQAERNNVDAACRAVEIRPVPPGVTDFRAVSSAGSTSISLTWIRPNNVNLQRVIVRRSDTAYPPSPTSGVSVFSGLGNAATDGPLVVGTTYYYSAWADYGNDDLSAPAHARAVAGQDPPADFFTELFQSNDNDLDNRSISFTPFGGSGFYRASGAPATALPVNPQGSTRLFLGDDASIQVTLTGGATVPLYGTSYPSFFVSSNGYITFGAGDAELQESFAAHFAKPRVAALFDDLDPSVRGYVLWKQLPDRAVVTFQNVSEYLQLTRNTFQIELFFNGVIRITYLAISARDGLAGLSEGVGVPQNFTESDFSSYGPLDLDADGLPDDWEVNHGLDPSDSSGNNGALGDPDSDGLTNGDEFTFGTHPMLADTDGDGLSDGDELHVHGTNPTLADTDSDGLSDGAEVHTYGTNPLDPDTDDDGYPDGGEVNGNSDPRNPNSYPVVRVDRDNVSGNQDGTTWARAFTTIQPAINRAVSLGGAEVWVAEGTYGESRVSNINGTNTGSVVLSSTVVRMYGGFVGIGAGGGETQRDQRNYQTHVTTIDGTTSRGGAAAFHVVYINVSTRLDGFRIVGGVARGASPGAANTLNAGGGVLCDGGAPTVANCTFSGNGGFYGGGLAAWSGQPQVVGCTFQSCTGDYGGGALVFLASPTFTNCRFTQNTATAGGGGLDNEGGSVTVAGCTFENNTGRFAGGFANYIAGGCTVTDTRFATNTGYNSGGMGNWASGSPSIVRCVFDGNVASNGAGGLYNLSANPVISESSFLRNRGLSGGAIYNNKALPQLRNVVVAKNTAYVGGGLLNVSSTVSMYNCTVAENTATTPGAAIRNETNSLTSGVNSIVWGHTAPAIQNGTGTSTNLTYSDVQGGYAGTGNINANPAFVSSANLNYHLQSGSPCINVGTAVGAPSIDRDGTARPQGAGFDMGAYEWFP